MADDTPKPTTAGPEASSTPASKSPQRGGRRATNDAKELELLWERFSGFQAKAPDRSERDLHKFLSRLKYDVDQVPNLSGKTTQDRLYEVLARARVSVSNNSPPVQAISASVTAPPKSMLNSGSVEGIVETTVPKPIASTPAHSDVPFEASESAKPNPLDVPFVDTPKDGGAATALKTVDRRLTQLAAQLSEFKNDMEAIGKIVSMQAAVARDTQALLGYSRELTRKHDELETEARRIRMDVTSSAAGSRETILALQEHVRSFESSLSSKIDLRDMHQILELRKQVEERVRAELIHSMSKLVAPALDVLKAQIKTSSGSVSQSAIVELERRLNQAGLVTDITGFF